MRDSWRFFLIAVLCIFTAGCATTVKYPLVRPEAFHFPSGEKAPVIGVLPPVVQVNANYGITDRVRLDPHIKRAQDELIGDFVTAVQRKGYTSFGKPVVFEGLPKDAQDRRLRWVVSDANTEFDLMARVIFMNAPKERDKPLEYRLGQLSAEVSDFLEPKPDWLMFVQTAAFVYGILPLSEVEDPTVSQRLGALMGVGIASPGYDYIVHVVGVVDARTGQLLWFNTHAQGSKSLVFPSDRRGSVEAALKEFPARARNEASKP